MDTERKTLIARILGYVCLAAGALNLLIAGIAVLRDRAPVSFPLLGTGLGALTLGIIMVSRGRQRPET